MSQQTPIGINIPIRNGKSGFFDQSFNGNEVAKNNLLMLISTRKGERRMNPEFGSGIWQYLFENLEDSSYDIIEDIIRKEVSQQLPEIVIKSVDILKKEENSNIYTIDLQISFYSNKYEKSVQILTFLANINQ